ncbi:MULTISPECIES: LacI family DNA-binding transcriptional regulator [unclassified Actinotalea]|uniref:LacI family DNA-binding transcriptional regulator n=1 Tax=unclassified Actinotalea TaxID=2638618 RepID=UPI0015F6A1AD|nr:MULTISPECIES: LacI family DNA-binding transcriptional regulator [unclassified Actinotalea]
MTKPNGARPNLSAVAAHAGVSVATASKVVHGRPDVAATTRERVERAITQLGYKTPAGRRSAGQRTVELMVDVLNSAYAMEVLRGATLAAEEHGVDIVVGRFLRRTPDGAAESSTAWTQRLAASGRLGAIVLTAGLGPEVYGSIVHARLPVVVIDPLDFTHPDVVSVGSTNWLGGRTAAEHLLSLGHTRLAVVAGPAQSMSAVARLDGFRSACAQAGIELVAGHAQQVGFNLEEAEHVAWTWLQRPDRPTGILASSDVQAMGVLQAARRVGLSVPRDVSVVSYDDTPVAGWASPPLTAVRQPLQEIGRRALHTVLRVHDGVPLDSNHIEIATSLVVRDSTTHPPLPNRKV